MVYAGECGNDVSNAMYGTNVGDESDELPKDIAPTLILDPVAESHLCVMQLTGGEYFSCALISNGRMRCWGQGIYLGLGLGSADRVGLAEAPYAWYASNSYDYVPVEGAEFVGGGSIVRIDSGRSSTCAVVSGKGPYCFGSGTSGRLGYNNTLNVGYGNTGLVTKLPYEVGAVVAMGATMSSLAVQGDGHGCLVGSNGSINCWGRWG